MAFTTSLYVAPVSTLVPVTATTAGDQRAGDLLALPDGSALMAYANGSGSLVLRRLTASGAGSGAETVVTSGANSIDAGPEHYANLATLANGNIVVSWSDLASPQIAHFRIYDQNLSPVTGVLNASPFAGSALAPDVAALSDGTFVLVWQRNYSSADHDILAHRYSATGAPVGSDILVNYSSDSIDDAPSVIGLAGGGFAVSHHRVTNGSDTSMWRSVWNADGSPRLADAVFDNSGDINAGGQTTVAPNGGFYVHYIENSWGAPTEVDVTTARFSAGGAAAFYTRDSATAAFDQQVDAATSADFYSIVTFQAFGGARVEGTLVAPNGVSSPRNVVLTTGANFSQFNPEVAWLSQSRFAMIETVSAAGPGNDGSGYGVAGVIYEARRYVSADGANDAINLTADGLANVVLAGAGADTVTTGAGDDQIYGGSGNDVIYAGAGQDTINGNDGEDIVHGGPDGDYILGGTEKDQLFGDEGIDSLYGEDGNDYLEAGAGASSVLVGGAGADVIYGGAGNDYAVGDDGDDTIAGLGGQDSLYGGAGNDYIVAGDGPGSVVDGGAGANTLWGGSGGDYMVGGEGGDLIVGLAGSDYMFGGAGYDSIYGGAATDYIIPGAGNDFIWTDDAGGASATDYIYVGGGSGVDTIADFTPGDVANHDVLVISPASGIANFAQLQAATAQAGVYSVITMAGGDQVWLYNVQPFQLTAADFLFF